MRRLKELDVFEGMPLFCGIQKPYFQTLSCGKGNVIAAGFFPAISDIATSDQRIATGCGRSWPRVASHRE